MKNINFIIMLLMITSVVFSKTYINFETGVNISSIDFEDSEVYDANIEDYRGYNFAVGIEHELRENFSIMPTISFETRGVSLSSNEDLFIIDIYSRYLQSQLYTKVIMPTSNVNFMLLVSPELGLKVSSKIDINGNTIDEDVLKVRNKLDFGLSYGAGIEVPIANNNGFITFKVIKYHGMLNTLRNDIESKNENFKINVGYKIDI